MSHILKENGVFYINNVLIEPAYSSNHVDHIHRLIHDNKTDSQGKFRLIPLSRGEIAQILDKFYVIELTGVPIACGSAVDYEWEGEWSVEIRSIAVDKGFQGQGLGKKLIGYGKERAGEMLKPYGTLYESVYATVSKDAPDAIAAFERNGFEFVADRSIPKIMRDCMRCPLYNNGCNEATYAAPLIHSPSGLLVPDSYHSSQNGSAYSGLREPRAVQ